MNNARVREMISVRTLQNLSNTLMRDLSEEEMSLILDKGVDYFIIEKLGMNDAEYQALKKIKNIISAYCTKSQADFDKELESNLDIPYCALKSIVNAMEDKMKGIAVEENKQTECWGTCPASEMIYNSSTEEDKTGAKALELCSLLNKIPESADNWMREYVKLVKDHSTVLNVLRSGQCPQTEDERIGDILDAIKDSVIDACIEKLKAEGEIELDPEIMSEVASKIWHSEDNVRINVINNKLKVEFK